VDEKGTEAAAASAVELKLRCAPPAEEAEFIADHPFLFLFLFLFLLRDSASELILFAGRVTNPAGRSRATARPRSQSGLLFRLAVLLSHDERHPVAHGSELGHAQRLAAASEVDVASLRRSIERLRGEIEHALPRVA